MGRQRGETASQDETSEEEEDDPDILFGGEILEQELYGDSGSEGVPNPPKAPELKP